MLLRPAFPRRSPKTSKIEQFQLWVILWRHSLWKLPRVVAMFECSCLSLVVLYLLLRWDPQTVNYWLCEKAIMLSSSDLMEWRRPWLCISIFLLGGVDGWINILMLQTKQVLHHCIAALFVSDASERNQIIQLCQE